eukprot:1668736-Rhodomonas_salina.2
MMPRARARAPFGVRYGEWCGAMYSTGSDALFASASEYGMGHRAASVPGVAEHHTRRQYKASRRIIRSVSTDHHTAPYTTPVQIAS